MEKTDCDIFEIWEDYKASLYLFILKRVEDKEAAKDILQDVLLKSYQYCSKGKTVLYLKSWLYKIAINTISDHFRLTGKRLPISFDLADERRDSNIVGEASEYIRILLKLLPEEYAIPLSFYDLDGFDQKQIAVKLNLTLSNTKSRIQRGRIKLKERFLECCKVSFDETGEMISFDIQPYCTEYRPRKKARKNILIFCVFFKTVRHRRKF
jgi:RNA polymerase sigma-70 factor, ECF subfamily